jgi:hypothetical protein
MSAPARSKAGFFVIVLAAALAFGLSLRSVMAINGSICVHLPVDTGPSLLLSKTWQEMVRIHPGWQVQSGSGIYACTNNADPVVRALSLLPDLSALLMAVVAVILGQNIVASLRVARKLETSQSMRKCGFALIAGSAFCVAVQELTCAAILSIAAPGAGFLDWPPEIRGPVTMLIVGLFLVRYASAFHESSARP